MIWICLDSLFTLNKIKFSCCALEPETALKVFVSAADRSHLSWRIILITDFLELEWYFHTFAIISIIITVHTKWSALMEFIFPIYLNGGWMSLPQQVNPHKSFESTSTLLNFWICTHDLKQTILTELTFKRTDTQRVIVCRFGQAPSSRAEKWSHGSGSTSIGH